MKLFTSGEVLTAADTNKYLRSAFAIAKSADESVTSSTSLQSDDHLVIAMEASTNYMLTMWIMHSGATAGDLQIDFTFPASTSFYYGLAAPATNIASVGTVSDATMAGYTEDTSSPSGGLFFGTTALSGTIANIALMYGYVSVGATAGNLQFRWAQNASSGTASVVHKGSWMRLDQVW